MFQEFHKGGAEPVVEPVVETVSEEPTEVPTEEVEYANRVDEDSDEDTDVEETGEPKENLRETGDENRNQANGYINVVPANEDNGSDGEAANLGDGAAAAAPTEEDDNLGAGAVKTGDGSPVTKMIVNAANSVKNLFSDETQNVGEKQDTQTGGTKQTQPNTDYIEAEESANEDTNASIARELNSIIRKIYEQNSGLNPEGIKTILCEMLNNNPIRGLDLPAECNVTPENPKSKEPVYVDVKPRNDQKKTVLPSKVGGAKKTKKRGGSSKKRRTSKKQRK